MQKCQNCGAEVKYIAGGFQKVYICDPTRVSAVTDNGRLFQGYILHVCKDNKDSDSEESGINEQSKQC